MMRRFAETTTFLILSILLVTGSVRSQQTANNLPDFVVQYPDLVLYNGKIVTMDDPALTNSSPGRIFQAMAVRGDRIQFLGSNAETLAAAGPKTWKIDLKGRTVIPGMMDTHNHLHDSAIGRWAKKNPEKTEAIAKTFSVNGKSFADITKGIEVTLKEYMAHPLPGQWAVIDLPGGGTGTKIGTQYIMQKQITRKDLDALAPKLPVYVNAHGANFLLNTAARDDFMRYYGTDPTDENEKETLTVSTIIGRSMFADRYFGSHLGELADLLEDQMKHQAAGGFTTISSHIQGGVKKMAAYTMLARAGRMPIRLAFAHRYCEQVEVNMPGCILRVGDWQGLGDKNQYFWNVGLTLGALDAGPPNICTTMEAPPQYKSQESCTIRPDPDNSYRKAIYTALASRDRYVMNHVYGDKAVDYVMDVMEQVMKDNPDITLDFMRSLRVSGDHCGFYPRQAQIPRMKNLGMIISCNANKLSRSAPWLKVYGADKSNRIAPMRSMINGGVMVTAEFEGVSYGTGEGVTEAAWITPLITRKNFRGELIGPDEAVDRVQSLKMVTVWSSYYVLKEKELGTLEPGKLADFVVLNKDYFTVSDAEFPAVFPLMTVVGGKPIVLREEFAKEMEVAPIGPQIKFQFKADYDFGSEADEFMPKGGGE